MEGKRSSLVLGNELDELRKQASMLNYSVFFLFPGYAEQKVKITKR